MQFKKLESKTIRTILFICLIISNVVCLSLLLVEIWPENSNIFSAVEFYDVETEITHHSNLTSGSCSWVPYENEPILSPSMQSEKRGDNGNLYAPDVLLIDGKYRMWYGAQDQEGHDQIHMATSDDGITWTKHGVVVPNNENNHVNDPSVIIVNSTFYMFYTTAPEGINDVISLATSENGWNWTIIGNVLLPDENSAWEELKVGRPAVLYQDDKFKLWYDGTDLNGYRTVGYAESIDGITWQRFDSNPIVSYPAGAIDVEYINGEYFMVAESGNGILWSYSENETDFGALSYLFKKTNLPWDQFGHVTPFILNQNNSWAATYVGVAPDSCWCQNRIAVWFPTMNISVYNDQHVEIIPDQYYMNSKTSLVFIFKDIEPTRGALKPNGDGEWQCYFTIDCNDTSMFDTDTYTIFRNSRYNVEDDDKLKNMFTVEKHNQKIVRL